MGRGGCYLRARSFVFRFILFVFLRATTTGGRRDAQGGHHQRQRNGGPEVFHRVPSPAQQRAGPSPGLPGVGKDPGVGEAVTGLRPSKRRADQAPRRGGRLGQGRRQRCQARAVVYSSKSNRGGFIEVRFTHVYGTGIFFSSPFVSFYPSRLSACFWARVASTGCLGFQALSWDRPWSRVLSSSTWCLPSRLCFTRFGSVKAFCARMFELIFAFFAQALASFVAGLK